MATESNKIKAKLATLDASLTELEDLLEPLLSHSMAETVTDLEPLQQAKLQTVLPYLIYDLVFVYLKAKGVDPRTHSVVTELDRVRQYFEKITHAENPSTRRVEVDKDAAGRFIKHAISQAMSKPRPMTPPPAESASVPAKVTTKMIARAQYERALQQESQVTDDDENKLEVFDGSSSDEENNTTSPARGDYLATSKKRRRAIDTFPGYEGERNVLEPSKKPKREGNHSKKRNSKKT